MSDKEQPDTEQPRRQNKGWSWGKGIIMIVLGGFSLFICCLYLFPELICWLPLFSEQWVTNKHVWLQLYLGALAVAGVVALCKPQIITSNPKKYFITSVLVTGITGGAFALLLPIAIKSTTTGVGGLRHSILLATGGLLAILTLGETRRKNDIDKDKNDKDHRRQVRAERRERYTKAVEQLGDEKAPIRMGGVYTLVGLIDEWLEDESIDKYEDRLKEGQVIINNLCAYIRSPFTLASHYDELSKANPTPKGIYKGKKEKFYADKATLDSEADVRLGIIKEIHDRLQDPEENTPGTWSDFEYDFSGSTFFYPIDLTNSCYTKPINFSGSAHQDRADFSGSTYQSWADFNGSTYQNVAYFRNSTYQNVAYFRNSTYQSWADFSGSIYQKKAHFGDSIYQGWAYFRSCAYQDWAYFSGSTYKYDADFSGSIFCSDAYFDYSLHSNRYSRFINRAPRFYDKINRKNTLFGSHNNNFMVDTNKGYPINLNSEGLPLDCKFLTSGQKKYLTDKFQEIDKTNNKLREVKDAEEKTNLIITLLYLRHEISNWRKEATTVKVEDVAAEDTES